MDYHKLVLAILFLLFGHLLRSERWKLLLNPYIRPRSSSLYSSLSIGYFGNIFFPFKLGEFFRALILSRGQSNDFSIILSSIIIERFFDLIVVMFFGLFAYFSMGFQVEHILDISLVLVSFFVMLIMVSRRNKYLLKGVYYISSFFNDQICFFIRNFTWIFYSYLRDIPNFLKSFRFYLYTFSMTICYVYSLYLLADFFSPTSETVKFYFDSLASIIYFKQIAKSSFHNLLFISSFKKSDIAFLMLYFSTPLILILSYAYFIKADSRIRISNFFPILNWHLGQELSYKLQVFKNNQDQSRFLNAFLTEKNSLVQNSIFLNPNVVVLKDISSGSNAYTWVISENNDEKIRKFAFDKDAPSLEGQTQWLKEFESKLPLATILKTEKKENYFGYDMTFTPACISFFEVIHMLSVEKSQEILSDILNRLESHLYLDQRIATDDIIEKYIQEKFTSNIQKILEWSSEITQSETMTINDEQVPNLSFYLNNGISEILMKMITHKEICYIHGDLTIENIIIDTTQLSDPRKCWYLIDPNPVNIFNTPYIDISKLFQSLNRGYEFLGKVTFVEYKNNILKYSFLKSSQYHNLMDFLKTYLGGKESSRLRDVEIHEIINYARLLPYKIKKQPNTALVYYGTLLLLLNTFWKKYVKE